MEVAETLAKWLVTTTGLVTDEPLSGDGKGVEAVRDRQAAA